MTIGQLGIKHPSLATMVDAIKSRISREALHQRFTKSSVDFIHRCAKYILKQKITQIVPIKAKLLKHFNRVMIVDGSSWAVDSRVADMFPGAGGAGSAAGCKVQAFYEYKRGELSFFELTAGTRPDNNYSRQLNNHVKTNDLLLVDLGYFRLQTLRDINTKGAYFLSRYPIGVSLFDAETGSLMELRKKLSSLPGDAYEFPVVMGCKKDKKVRCRLICLRVSEEAANKRRRRVRKRAKQRKRAPNPLRLALCDWMLMITNIPKSWLTAEMAHPLYSLRWQIELFFKQIKTVLCIHHSNTANVHRLQCEIYGKLIMAVFIHRIHSVFNGCMWNSHHREVSMDKLYKRIQERAFVILRFMLISLPKACLYLAAEIPRLIKNCIKTRQPSRKTSLEILEYGIKTQTEVYQMAV